MQTTCDIDATFMHHKFNSLRTQVIDFIGAEAKAQNALRGFEWPLVLAQAASGPTAFFLNSIDLCEAADFSPIRCLRSLMLNSAQLLQ